MNPQTWGIVYRCVGVRTYVCVCVLMTLCMSVCTIVALTESSNSAVPCSEHSSREGGGSGTGLRFQEIRGRGTGAKSK